MKAFLLGLSFFAWLAFLVFSPVYVLAAYLLELRITDQISDASGT